MPFWQTLSRSCLTPLALAEWQQLLRYEQGGDPSRTEEAQRLLDAIAEYQKRERRYGGLGKQPADVTDVADNHEPASKEPEQEHEEEPASVTR